MYLVFELSVVLVPQKNKEDEAMTPVRRSSRLRNQVKSPEEA
jgi:hypothetical protein